MNQGSDVNLFYLAFTAYFAGFLAFSIFAAFGSAVLHRTGAALVSIGAVCHSAAFIARWKLSGHIPLSNMYEYLLVMSWMAAIMLLFLYARYRRPIIGSFIAPIVFMLMVTAALLPKDINQSLMPALQSVWLYIHVSMAALGAGCFAVSFAASALYLIKRYNPADNRENHHNRLLRNALVGLIGLPLLVTAAAFIAGLAPPAPQSNLNIAGLHVNAGSIFILLGIGFLLSLIVTPLMLQRRVNGDSASFNGWLFIAVTLCFLCGGLVEGVLLKSGWLELTHSLSQGNTGGESKSAWLFFEFIGFAYSVTFFLSILLFPIIFKFSRRFAGARILNLDFLDDVSYKSVSLGYPLYTIGALFAGAIWAEQAWGSFWSWDPKEVGALIIWLFYSGYLHARFQKGWRGSRAAIIVVTGFLMVLVSFLGNYFFGGLHTYA